MDIGNMLKSAAKAVASEVVQDVETYLIPVRLQQLYKGYKLRNVSLARTGMPVDFLITMAQLADHIYLTGTRRGDSRSDGPAAQKLTTELGALFQNYEQIYRFDAATGLAFETRGPFGAVVASAVPPGLERVPLTGPVNPGQVSYRLFILFRGTVPKALYTDDISTDIKAAAPKQPSNLGNCVGELALGFLNTYNSCRSRVIEQLLPRGLNYLRAVHRNYSESAGKTNSGPAAGANTSGRRIQANLPLDQIELYIVGHSLGGAVATLCAYDIACRFPHYNPTLITFGSPPVGNIDFAIDFNKVMVQRNEYHPRTRYLRSVRVVARAKDNNLDAVSALPALLPNYIHVNSELVIPSVAGGRLGAHSMTGSYIPSLKKAK